MNAKELQAEMSEVVRYIETPTTAWGGRIASLWEMPEVYVEVGGKQLPVTGVVLHNASKRVYLKVGEQ